MSPAHWSRAADPEPDEVQPYSALEALWRAQERLSPVATIKRCEAKWQWLVEEVESGYDDIREEWENDLDSREIIQRAIDALPTPLSERLAGRVRPWDDRFKAATKPVARPYSDGGWWSDRVPIELGPKLAAELGRYL